jgi:hypothetical protein
MTEDPRRRSSALLVFALVASAVCAWLWLLPRREAAAAWPGVDDAVIGEFARAAGRGEAGFSLDWVQGDLLLFAFLSAGLLAGGVLGYVARMLFVEPRGTALAEDLQSQPDMRQSP